MNKKPKRKARRRKKKDTKPEEKVEEEKEEEPIPPGDDHEPIQEEPDELYEPEYYDVADSPVMDPPRRRSERIANRQSSGLANPLNESESDMELDDGSASFQHVLWQ